MTGSQVKTERRGRVLVMRLDNPPRNFMTAVMMEELDELTRPWREGIRVDLVGGTG